MGLTKSSCESPSTPTILSLTNNVSPYSLEVGTGQGPGMQGSWPPFKLWTIIFFFPVIISKFIEYLVSVHCRVGLRPEGCARNIQESGTQQSGTNFNPSHIPLL